MTQCEYRARTFHANKEDDLARAYIKDEYPNLSWDKLPKNSGLALEAYLNNWGEAGWELVSIEPVNHLGANGDLGYTYPDVYTWRASYFCVFKRNVD